jgi:NAD(P)-dependent dehydrogenase (short-subunit alcohol dehydrogenase family)
VNALKGKVMLVTGGAHRVGKAIALCLAEKGADIVITYQSSESEARQTVTEITKLGVKAVALHCDQQEVDQIQGVINEISRQFDRLDGLVNCASIMQEIPFFEITPDAWDTTLAVNTRGPFFFTQMAAKLMLEGKSAGGAIINILDESATVPTKYFVHHSASKAALHMLTRSSALALAPAIRVNAVLPGPVLMPEGGDADKWQRLEKNTPLKHLGTPADVARAVAYLMQEEFITGQVLTVDGGRTIK